MNKVKNLFALGVALIGTFSLSQAQMSVTNSTPYNSSAYLLQNVFMGSNINEFNFKYNVQIIPESKTIAAAGWAKPMKSAAGFLVPCRRVEQNLQAFMHVVLQRIISEMLCSGSLELPRS